MTAAEDEAWIQNSLARLESLETQREQLEATGQTQKLAEVDEEIRSLYEVLESVAGDDDSEQVTAPAAVAPVAAVPAAAPAAAPVMAAAPAAAPPVMAAAPAADPYGAPGMAADAGMAPPVMEPDYSSMGDDDIKPPGSSMPLIIVALVVLIGGGAGAYMFMGNKAEEAKAPEPTGPATIIKAGPIAEDTQEPVVAKGADGDRTPGTELKEGSNPGASRSHSGGKRRHSGSRRKNKADDGRKIKVGDSRDPLAGVN